MSSLNIDQISSVSSADTFAPVAVYRLKYYQPQSVFDQVLYALIRPPRFVYNQRLLIPGRRYQRRFDYQVHNIPFPLSIYWCQDPKYIILYLHGNSSSRFEGYLHLKELPDGACLACFDFKGCGLRKDGQYITLGKDQCGEVDKAVDYLKMYGYPIVGWGRSMGAVSLLMSSKCDIMIADSPFSSLYDLCKETSLNVVPSCLCCLVHCIFPCLFCCVRCGVEKKSGMDPNQLQVIKAVQKMDPSKSLLILAGKDDSMIHYSHSQKLYQSFKGTDKRIILFDGTHNSNRPEQVIDECFEFIYASILKRKQNGEKVLKPLAYDSACRVLKIQRYTSQESITNQKLLTGGQSTYFPVEQPNSFQSSKQALLVKPSRHPMELKQIKVQPSSRSSPKKLSKIEGDSTQIIDESNMAQITHEQEMVRQGIGKFQQDLNKQKVKCNGAISPYKTGERFSFKEISKKNEVESSESPKRGIVLKSIKPINDITLLEKDSNGSSIKKQSSDRAFAEIKLKPISILPQSQRPILGKNSVKTQPHEYDFKVQSLQTPVINSKGLREQSSENSQQGKNMKVSPKKMNQQQQVNNQRNVERDSATTTVEEKKTISIFTSEVPKEMNSPMSGPTTLLQDDVKLLEEENDNSMKSMRPQELSFQVKHEQQRYLNIISPSEGQIKSKGSISHSNEPQSFKQIKLSHFFVAKNCPTVPVDSQKPPQDRNIELSNRQDVNVSEPKKQEITERRSSSKTKIQSKDKSQDQKEIDFEDL